MLAGVILTGVILTGHEQMCFQWHVVNCTSDRFDPTLPCNTSEGEAILALLSYSCQGQEASGCAGLSWHQSGDQESLDVSRIQGSQVSCLCLGATSTAVKP